VVERIKSESIVTSRWLNEPDDISKHYGFIYKITHVATGKFYIGKKFFWSEKTRKPLKGKKNKRHYLKESDWKTYYGSSTNLLADIEKYGQMAFKREIIAIYDNKWDCAYYELLEQLKENVLFRDDSYNEIINVRLRKRKGLN